MIEIDCRGLACPQPVLRAKKALDNMQEEEVLVIVDNPAAKENLERLANFLNYIFKLEKKEDNNYYIIIKKPKGNEYST